jgi:gliding motility-associated-like protein
MIDMKNLLVTLLLWISCMQLAHAQIPIYNMKDTTVQDCKGKLYDSGGLANIYKHNEDYVFSICSGGPIKLTFVTGPGNFCIEDQDSLFFFDGPSITSPKIGVYTGTTAPPPILANSGCLTVYFKSDANVAYCGWQASWTSTVTPPVPPEISTVPSPQCNDTKITLSLTKPFSCDSLQPSDFKINGPIKLNVTNATGVSCTNKETSTIQLDLDKPINENCNYTVTFDFYLLDNCDSAWHFTKTCAFLVSNCAYTVSIKNLDGDTICAGDCVSLQAKTSAPCLNFNYTWSDGLPPTAGTHSVCPTVTTTYTVTMQEQSGNGPLVSTTHMIVVVNPQINALLKDTICQSDPSFKLTANINGGTWTGKGITDTKKGIFDPDSSGAGTFYISYSLKSGCKDSIRIVVKCMDAGFDDAACPGSSPFQLIGFTPSGGTWSGTNITSCGVFDPATAGTYTVTYTHPNGCSDTKRIFVQALNIPSTVDTVCQSAASFTLNVNPFGGRWSGTGIVDTLYGEFSPGKAGPGLHLLIYKLHGCTDTFRIFVKELLIGEDRSACPSQGIITITPVAKPPGGTWIGKGIVDPVAGTYNPGFKGGKDFIDTLVYTHPNGCSDRMIMYNYKTEILDDSVLFCSDDKSILLDWNSVNNYPWGGVWTGNGLTTVNKGNYKDYYFSPKKAGPGRHLLKYTINTCMDSMMMIVYPSQLSVSTMSVCTNQPPFKVDSLSPNATWKGKGIIDSKKGVFDPQLAGLGTVWVHYASPAGCIDSVRITVYPYAQAKISGLNSIYCYKDTNIKFICLPKGNKPTGIKLVNDSVFNPAVAGPGKYLLQCSAGAGYCKTIDSLTITVLPPVTTTLTVTTDTICGDGSSTISVKASGGASTKYVYTWNNGLISLNAHTVTPKQTTTYIIRTSDGCSDDVLDTVVIAVYPAFKTSIVTSPQQCYGQNGFITVTNTPPANYSYTWNTKPISTTSSLNVPAGKSYTLRVLNVNTGCYFDTLIKVPSYPIVKALFSPTPNAECVTFDERTITFLDLCNGADTGVWDFGDTIIQYMPGKSAGNCKDEYTLPICILPPTDIFIPDIFSPNQDGINDLLMVRGKGIVELKFILYDRWGEKIFETEDAQKGWDGTFRGKAMDPAVFVYYVKAVLTTGEKIERKGNISLVR